MSSAAGAQSKKMSMPNEGANSLRAAKDELVRRHILDAAEWVFAESGFTQTKMQTIAKQAGVSLATLYQFYPGKQELYRSVLLSRDEEMMAVVMNQPALASGLGLSVVAVLSLQSGHLAFLLSHPNYLKLILHEGYAWYHSAAQPTENEQALWEQGLKLMTTVFEHGMKVGELIKADPADQARLLMALQQARLASWVADGMQEGHTKLIARIQADFVRQFCTPKTASELLTADGCALRDDVLQQTLSVPA